MPRTLRKLVPFHARMLVPSRQWAPLKFFWIRQAAHVDVECEAVDDWVLAGLSGQLTSVERLRNELNYNLCRAGRAANRLISEALQRNGTISVDDLA